MSDESTLPVCPRCGGSNRVHLSRRREWFMDLLMRLVYGQQAYSCHGCGERFYFNSRKK